MRVLIFGLFVVTGLGLALVRGTNGEAVDGGVSDERAEIIAQSCATCHGTEGRLDTAIPSLAGRPAAVLAAQLAAFKNDEMPDATVMPRLARGYTDEELEAVARYFAGLNSVGN